MQSRSVSFLKRACACEIAPHVTSLPSRVAPRLPRPLCQFCAPSTILVHLESLSPLAAHNQPYSPARVFLQLDLEEQSQEARLMRSPNSHLDLSPPRTPLPRNPPRTTPTTPAQMTRPRIHGLDGFRLTFAHTRARCKKPNKVP